MQGPADDLSMTGFGEQNLEIEVAPDVTKEPTAGPSALRRCQRACTKQQSCACRQQETVVAPAPVEGGQSFFSFLVKPEP